MRRLRCAIILSEQKQYDIWQITLTVNFAKVRPLTNDSLDLMREKVAMENYHVCTNQLPCEGSGASVLPEECFTLRQF